MRFGYFSWDVFKILACIDNRSNIILFWQAGSLVELFNSFLLQILMSHRIPCILSLGQYVQFYNFEKVVVGRIQG